MRVMLDTCIIIDIIEEREPFVDDSKKVMNICCSINFKAYVSAKQISDIYYILQKHYHDSIKSKEVLLKLINLLNIINSTESDCYNALFNQIGDYEDGILVENALSNKIDCIVTRNLKDFKNSLVKIYSPKEFIFQFSNYYK